MARIVWDGFDRYTGGANYGLDRWDADFTFNSGAFSATTPFTDGRSMQFDFQGYGNKTFGSAVTGTVTLGFHFILGGFGGGATSHPGFFNLWDGATKQVTGYCNRATVGAAYPAVARGANGGNGGTELISHAPISPMTLWSWIEIVIVLGTGTSGSVSTYQNGTLLQTVPSLNTAPSGTAQVTKLTVGSFDPAGGFSTSFIDNFYMLDATGGAPWNSRLGEARAYLRKPNADSAVQWTPNSGANNWSRVSDSSVDDDTTYNSSATAGQADLFDVADLPGGLAGTVLSIAHSTRARKDDAGTRTMHQSIKSGATQTNEAAFSVGNGYVTVSTFKDINPATSAAYTVTEINALKIGYGIDS